MLLARTRMSDIADAAVALLGGADDVVLTSDAGDIEHLLDNTAARRRDPRRLTTRPQPQTAATGGL